MAPSGLRLLQLLLMVSASLAQVQSSRGSDIHSWVNAGWSEATSLVTVQNYFNWATGLALFLMPSFFTPPSGNEFENLKSLYVMQQQMLNQLSASPSADSNYTFAFNLVTTRTVGGYTFSYNITSKMAVSATEVVTLSTVNPFIVPVLFASSAAPGALAGPDSVTGFGIYSAGAQVVQLQTTNGTSPVAGTASLLDCGSYCPALYDAAGVTQTPGFPLPHLAVPLSEAQIRTNLSFQAVQLNLRAFDQPISNLLNFDSTNFTVTMAALDAGQPSPCFSPSPAQRFLPTVSDVSQQIVPLKLGCLPVSEAGPVLVMGRVLGELPGNLSNCRLGANGNNATLLFPSFIPSQVYDPIFYFHNNVTFQCGLAVVAALDQVTLNDRNYIPFDIILQESWAFLSNPLTNCSGQLNMSVPWQKPLSTTLNTTLIYKVVVYFDWDYKFSTLKAISFLPPGFPAQGLTSTDLSQDYPALTLSSSLDLNSLCSVDLPQLGGGTGADLEDRVSRTIEGLLSIGFSATLAYDHQTEIATVENNLITTMQTLDTQTAAIGIFSAFTSALFADLVVGDAVGHMLLSLTVSFPMLWFTLQRRDTHALGVSEGIKRFYSLPPLALFFAAGSFIVMGLLSLIFGFRTAQRNCNPSGTTGWKTAQAMAASIPMYAYVDTTVTVSSWAPNYTAVMAIYILCFSLAPFLLLLAMMRRVLILVLERRAAAADEEKGELCEDKD